MGCQNSKESNDPQGKQNTGALLKKESFKPLTQIDKERIKKVLDYWFDDSQANNSLNGSRIQKDISSDNQENNISIRHTESILASPDIHKEKVPQVEE